MFSAETRSTAPSMVLVAEVPVSEAGFELGFDGGNEFFGRGGHVELLRMDRRKEGASFASMLHRNNADCKFF